MNSPKDHLPPNPMQVIFILKSDPETVRDGMYKPDRSGEGNHVFVERHEIPSHHGAKVADVTFIEHPIGDVECWNVDRR